MQAPDPKLDDCVLQREARASCTPAKRYRGTYYLRCQRALAYLLFLLSVLVVGLASLVELCRAPWRELEAATGVAG